MTNSHCRYLRSIPACAGEPVLMVLLYQCIRVYPRVCGGTPYKSVGGEVPHGLSPRVRGTVSCWNVGVGSPGLSPRVRGNPVRA